MGDDNDYQPISCALYSEYELAIMHREWWRLRWRDRDGIDHVATVRPTDLRTEADKSEVLVGRDLNDTPLTIRLDQIIDRQVIAPPQRPSE